MSDPRRLLLAGDTHGDAAWVEWLAFVSEEQGCDGIIQLGDFGFWPGDKGVRFLDDINESCEKHGQTLWCLDGNHDWHPWILEQPIDPDTGMRPVRDHVIHLPRGCHWLWSGVRFVALGGSYSVDKAYRTEGVDWWPQETITEADADAAMSAGEVDIMLTHDAPTGAEPLAGTGERMYRVPEQDANRILLRVVTEAVRPTVLVHGHWHNRYAQPLPLNSGWTTHVVGLDKEWTGSKNWEVLELQRVAG